MPRTRSISPGCLLVASLVFAGTVATVYWQFRAADQKGRSEKSIKSRPVLHRPPPRDSTYVGSQACAQCHKEIYDRFIESPMGLSMATVDQAHPIEDYEKSTVEPSKQRHYVVTRDEHTLSHCELMLDTEGEVYNEQSEEISFIVGSGKRGRSYLIERDGLLFQSPVGWYTHGERWDLSPGYTPQRHSRFSRRIGDGCLYCHAGRMLNEGLATDRYEQPVFAEVAIGCERCHGPGEQHMQFHTDERSSAIEDTIVNPIDLPASKRESVCNQCHLLGRSVVPRYGRQFFDFRPGDELSDVFVILSQETDVGVHSKQKAVNQVEQMRASECYKASDGRLGCISCHDPHSVPGPGQRAEHYRLRCLSCHDSNGCSLDIADRNKSPANNSCIVCHMPASATLDVPHTSLTDHRILRDPAEPQSDGERLSHADNELTVVGNSNGKLPRAEIERALGIALMTTAWNNHDEYLAAKALANLSESVDGQVNEYLRTSDDISLLDEFAAGYLMLRNIDMAELCWKRMLELNPRSETALMGMAKVLQERQDVPGLGRYLERVLELNPTSEDALNLLANQRHYAKDTAGAIEAAERGLAINPNLVQLRTWLINTYRRLGRDDEVAQHETFLAKLKAVTADAEQDSEE